MTFRAEEPHGCDCSPICLCKLDGDPIAQNIVKMVRDRLVLGRQRHGTWDQNEGLDMHKEAMEEAADFMVYAMRSLMRPAEKK